MSSIFCVKNPCFLDNFPSNLKLLSLFFSGKDTSALFFDSFRYRVKVFLYVIFYLIVSLKILKTKKLKHYA